jgi:hypothetical protein
MILLLQLLRDPLLVLLPYQLPVSAVQGARWLRSGRPQHPDHAGPEQGGKADGINM